MEIVEVFLAVVFAMTSATSSISVSEKILNANFKKSGLSNSKIEKYGLSSKLLFADVYYVCSYISKMFSVHYEI